MQTSKTKRLAFDKLRYYVYDACGEFRAYPCLYCGLPSTDEEHVLPKSHLQHLAELGIYVDEVLVPSCRECNNIAGDQVFDNWRGKYDHIHARLRTKYKRVLETPEWTTSALAQMGRSMKAFIRRHLRLKAQLLERLNWDPESVLNVDEILYLQGHGKGSVGRRAAQATIFSVGTRG